jgi:hypothetical protein
VRNRVIQVGDYPRYDDPGDFEGFQRNGLCHFSLIDRPVIGCFRAMARGAKSS